MSNTNAQRPWCSLITVTYNSSAALTEFWGKAGHPPMGIEWIVVDNGSTDGTQDVARKLGATVIERDGNFGFSSSNNVGVEASSGAFIGFVNPDISIDYRDLVGLRDLARDRSAIVSPQLLNADGTQQPNGRGYPFLVDKIRNRIAGDSRRPARYLLFGAGTEPRVVSWLMGASIFGMRESIDALGGWDSRFFLYYEDSDICIRAWDLGIDVLLAPKYRWLHGWARETSTASATPWKREISSMVKFYSRYPEFLLGTYAAGRRHPLLSRKLKAAHA